MVGSNGWNQRQPAGQGCGRRRVRWGEVSSGDILGSQASSRSSEAALFFLRALRFGPWMPVRCTY